MSLVRPSAPHILPPIRIMAGIEASTITSFGACRFEMPLAESTIASSGRCSWQACMSRMTSSRFDSGSASILVYRSTRPLFTFTPSSSNSFWCLAKASL
ncbi:hypothetical protein D3C87_1273780 [compost metagenome]